MPKNRQEKNAATSRKSMTGKQSADTDRQMSSTASEPRNLSSARSQVGTDRGTSSGKSSRGDQGGLLRRMASKVRNIFRRGGSAPASGGADIEMPLETQLDAPKMARATRREADIPMDQLDGAYIPTQTSLKSGFRDDGAERHRSQEYATGVADDRWNDEDHYTNKSEDPRIGTRGRTYEPGEAREGSRE